MLLHSVPVHVLITEPGKILIYHIYHSSELMFKGAVNENFFAQLIFTNILDLHLRGAVNDNFFARPIFTNFLTYI